MNKTERCLDLLEKGFFGLIAEEFVIRVGTSREAYFDLCGQLKKFSELCKIFPNKKEQLEKEFKETKLKIAQELLKKSLLISTNDSNLFSLSGNPFPIKQN